jgi:SAM-dependent methyltransferase
MSFVAELSPQYRFTPPPRFAHYCTSALNRVSDRFWEARYRLNTRGGAPSPHADAHHYGYLAYHTYFSIFDRLQLTPDDVVVDLGCGKGRVVCVAATYRVKAAIGVEIDPPLCEIAEKNAASMHSRRAPIRIACQSAVDFDYDDTNVIVMFHPFGADTMRAVLAQWERSLERRPRIIRIAYGNPILSPLLAAKPWLQLTECWQPRMWSRLKFPVHFYQACLTTA